MYPGLSMGRRAGENSVAWRSDTWEMVRPGLIPIPYFNGNIRPMPYVLLRNKQTGVQAYFSTFHNPANIGGNMPRFRREATRREINLFNQLETQGIPQFVTGDMNDNNEYFCPVTAETPLIAAAGGSNNGGCAPPRPTPIDWIFGSPGVVFPNYVYDQSPLVRRTTDHPVWSARVTIDALKFKNALRPHRLLRPAPQRDQHGQHPAMVVLGPVQPQLGEDVRDVALHGLQADRQAVGDRAVRASLGHQRQHVALPLGQRGQRVGSRLAGHQVLTI